MKPYQKKLITGVGSEEDEKYRMLIKVDPIPLDLEEKQRIPIKVDSIPLDLEVDILTRLPAKSLIKFQSVSNLWSSIIRSQRFINSHYAMSSTMRSRFMIAFSNGALANEIDMRFFIFSCSHEDMSDSLVANLDVTIPALSLSRGSNCASVHGIIGFTNSGPFIVCNPSTKTVTTLSCAGARTYLGYDPVDDQFKALTLPRYPYWKPNSFVHDVLTLGGELRNEVTTPPYYTATKPICINGFVYFGAWTPRPGLNPVIVCFDVRDESMSFITAPADVMVWEGDSILTEYKGKLASIARRPYVPLDSFDLWILEDVKSHYWSKQTFELPFSLGKGKDVFCPGINKAGDIIFAPRYLSHDVQPFYLICYNVETKCIRRVRVHGIADREEFRRHYGIAGECCVYISPEHVESIASL